MNTLQTIALEWLDKNVSPIPVCYRSKTPAVQWHMWQFRKPTRKIVIDWFADQHKNLGVICGGVSNLAIIDFDNIDYYHDWRKDMVKRDDIWRMVATKTYRVRTPRGMHLYLKTISPEQSRKYPETSVDIRCKGNYTLVPPSIHPSGNRYVSIGSTKDIITVDTLETVFPYQSVIDQYTPREMDIFSIGANVTIADLKERVPITRFVESMRKVTKNSRNGRYLWSKCVHPSHKDTHPSFQIDTLKQRAKCMSPSCPLYHDIGYDVIDLYKIIYGVDTHSAITDLELMYG